MASRICKTLSLAERIEVIKKLENNESQAAVAKHFGVHPSQISRILKHKERLLADWKNNSNPDRKRRRVGKAEDVEVALLRWFSEASRHLPVNGPLLIEKANQFAVDFGIVPFKATIGWLERWKDRNNIKFKKQIDSNEFGADRWVADVLPGILKDYRSCDVFNADETGLYWRALLDDTLALEQCAVADSKVSKERLTLLLACNMDGSEKLEPLIIGSNRQPECFQDVKKLPLEYEVNENAWMTKEIWVEWVKKFDNDMKSQNRQIVLFCDSCGAHSEDVCLSNIKVVLIPANAASIQPMNQGIIAIFKKNYRSLVLSRLTSVLQDETDTAKRVDELTRNLTLLDSLSMLKEAWSQVAPITIMNCYKKAHFLQRIDGSETTTVAINSIEMAFSIPMCVTADQFNRYVTVDDDLKTTSDDWDTDLSVKLEDTSDNLIDAGCMTSHTTKEADDADGDNDYVDNNCSNPVVPMFSEVLKSLDVLHSYMESNGCQSFDRFYSLVDQIYDIDRQASLSSQQ